MDPYNPESFRDSVATIDEKGKRKWIFAQKPFGKYYNARSIATIIYLVIFFTLPFLKIDGEPLFMINLPERRFILFGQTFWPHDFIIFGLGMITFIVFIILFTVTFGRVFCGWACPQTVFLEMVFRRIEYWIEGDANKQKAITKMPWNAEKIRKRGLKLVIYFLISFIISNTFLAYIIGVDDLFKIISEPISMHLTGFSMLIIFTFIFFFVFTWFREQACIVVCPYGRLQGVLLDKDSIVVAYDHVRGEPRGKIRKGEERKIGDCIDCHQCVRVCPTGIDIRHGTQLECVNCTACIDACDDIMDKVNLPKGLIRYASENNISKGKKLTITPRMIAYSLVLLLLLGVEAVLLLTRTDVDATAMRAQGTLFQQQDSLHLSNLYNLKVVNKTKYDLPVTFKLEDIDGEIKVIGESMVLKKQAVSQGNFFIVIHKKDLVKRKTKVRISIYSGEKKLQTIKTIFLGPISLGGKRS